MNKYQKNMIKPRATNITMTHQSLDILYIKIKNKERNLRK